MASPYIWFLVFGLATVVVSIVSLHLAKSFSIWVILYGVLGTAFAFAHYRLFGHPGEVSVCPYYLPSTKDNSEQIARFVLNEQRNYEWIWQNWLGTSWLLTLLAAASAIGTAVTSAMKDHDNPKSKKWTAILAGLTVAATTLSTTLGASVQADHYRRGDLKLQDAMANYRSDHDATALLKAWQDAQSILEGSPEENSKNHK